MMYRIITHNDLDGYGSGYLVKDMLENHEGIDPDNIKIYIMDYAKELDLSEFNKNDEVWITDYSLKPDVMNKLLDITENITWIDHHKSALEYISKYNKPVKGIQTIGLAATALTYLWFYAPKELLYLSNERLEEWLDKNAPRWIDLVDAWDVWKLNSKYYEGGRLLSLALSPQLSIELVGKLKDKDFLKEIVQKGKIYDEYQQMSNNSFVNQWGFELPVEFDSNTYKAFVMNKGGCSSLAFGDKIKDYDMCISFILKEDKLSVSVYSDKDYIDCSEICKAHGGGGHKGAAGYTVNLMDILSNKEVK